MYAVMSFHCAETFTVAVSQYYMSNILSGKFAIFNMQFNVHSVLFKVYLSNIFTGFFVLLMFLVLTLFLIYGVELFYKVWLTIFYGTAVLLLCLHVDSE